MRIAASSISELTRGTRELERPRSLARPERTALFSKESSAERHWSLQHRDDAHSEPYWRHLRSPSDQRERWILIAGWLNHLQIEQKFVPQLQSTCTETPVYGTEFARIRR